MLSVNFELEVMSQYIIRLIINGNIKKVVKHLLLHQNKDTIQKKTQ